MSASLRFIAMVFIVLANTISIQAGAKISAQKQVLTLITHEAPPYMSEALPNGGAIFYAISKVIEPLNYDLKVVFAPSWTRAKMNAIKDPNIDGYAPYRTVEQQDLFDFSEYIFESPWVIIERKDHPIQWKTPEDLVKYTAGNVQGVELRPGVKELWDQKKIKIETTTTQNNNLLKLATKRVDYIFSDQFAFRYLMTTDPTLLEYNGKLQINPKPIVIEKYGVALKKSKDSKKILQALNQATPKLKGYAEEYFALLEKQKNP